MQFGEGWAVNSRDGASVGLMYKVGTPSFAGLVLIDNLRVYSDPSDPTSALQKLPVDVAAWLAAIPGIRVEPPRSFAVGSMTGTEYKFQFVPVEGGPSRLAIFNVGAAGFVPVPFGSLPNQIFQMVVFEKDGDRLSAGFGGGTEDPTQPLKDLLVSIEHR